MNLEAADRIAKAVLYEGYMLYPYRVSSVKNQQRFNFGVLYPQDYCDAQEGAEASSLRVECLVQGSAGTVLASAVRFLHLQTRTPRQVQPGQSSSARTSGAQGSGSSAGWQEAVEREVRVPEWTLAELCVGTCTQLFAFPPETHTDPEYVREQAGVEGEVEMRAEEIRDPLLEIKLFKVSVRVRNTMRLQGRAIGRDDALARALVSCHVVLGVGGGDFVSLLEPPAELEPYAAKCQSVGCFPVMVGEVEQRDTLLASPIILYDYPQIAPESAGDLFDGTEIDEILSLRIMTLTDEEKNEIRQSDERAREILERTETMPPEQFIKLHGAVRGLRPLGEDAR